MIFVTLITLVSAILQIILFFKVWGMCDDVKRMTAHFCGEQETTSINEDFKARIATGGQSTLQDAQRMLAADLKAIAKKAQGLLEEDYLRIYGTTPNKDIADVKAKYKAVYSKSGREFPSDIQKVTTIEDLWELFQD